MGTLNSQFPGGIQILSHDSGHTLLTHLEQLLINSSKYFPFYALPASRTPLTCVHLPRALPAEAGTMLLRAGKAGGMRGGKVAVTMRRSGTASPLPQAGSGAWHRGPRSWKEMTHWDYLGCQQRAEASGKKAWCCRGNTCNKYKSVKEKEKTLKRSLLWYRTTERPHRSNSSWN